MTALAHNVTTAVVGLGLSGMSCLRHLSATDALVVIDDRDAPANLIDAKRAFPEAQFFVGQDAALPHRWHGVERVVLSPGVAANDPVLEGSENLPRFSDIDLFMLESRAPVIGITGTNGKSTVTALLGHVLQELGVAVRIGGNLGEPALDLLTASAQLYVLELSSFQIEHSKDLALAAATVLNVSADHLDRHGSIDNYAAIKRRIYALAEFGVSNADDALTHPDKKTGAKGFRCVSFGLAPDARWQLAVRGDNCELRHKGVVFAQSSDFALTGQHNLLNLLAAFALIADLDLPGLPSFEEAPEHYVAAAKDFTGLEHRAEFVRELRGVRYVNDSKATNVGACVAALSGFTESSQNNPNKRVVLLAGGQGKAADFAPLGLAAERCVKAAILFGEDAQLLEEALAAHTATHRCADFPEAVETAQRLASAGDTVLLAPACASFDMFVSFTDRGNRFRDLVGALS